MAVKEDLPVSRFRTILLHNGLTPQTIRAFQGLVYEHYSGNARTLLPWRKTRNSYRILVSEIMLQQTQVERVLGKYKVFIRTFPDFLSLANAPLSDILKVWQGLGYNRRAVALKKIALAVMEENRGRLPVKQEELLRLPGIGRYTASAILTFAGNQPHIFIETNIRRIFIHFFFRDRETVSDAEILPLIEKTLDYGNPREWYYALMDYGAVLKKTIENPNRKSARYRRQSPFHGSNRQLRGLIIKALIRNPGISQKKLVKQIGSDPEKTEKNLSLLLKEGFLKKKG
ncbi:MAG: A/G-specific adenine glycosylase, partial [Nitrospirota bacterium]|nr:A/G-specific adenine glycosylase [Nitrospirota bacterium]